MKAMVFAHDQSGPGALPASYITGSVWGRFLELKRPGRGVNRPPPSSAEVKERVELYHYVPSGLSWPLLGRTFYFIKPFKSSVGKVLNVNSTDATSHDISSCLKHATNDVRDGS